MSTGGPSDPPPAPAAPAPAAPAALAPAAAAAAPPPAAPPPAANSQLPDQVNPDTELPAENQKTAEERADRTALALRTTSIALCSVYPSPHVYMFFQDVHGNIRLMNWDCASDPLSNEFKGPGTVKGVLKEADNARWSTPLAAVAYESIRRYCCLRHQQDNNLGGEDVRQTLHSADCDHHSWVNKSMDTIHLFYLNSENFLRSLVYKDNRWEHDSKLSQCLVRVHPNTKLAATFTGEDNSIPQSVRVYFQAALDEQIHEYVLSHGRWSKAVVTRGSPVCGTWLAASVIPVYKNSVVLFYQSKLATSSVTRIVSCYKSPSTRWTEGAWGVEDPILWQRPYPFTLLCEPKDVPSRHGHGWKERKDIQIVNQARPHHREVVRLYYYSPNHGSARLQGNAWVLKQSPEAIKNPSENHTYTRTEGKYEVIRKHKLVTCTHKSKLYSSLDYTDRWNENQTCMYPSSDIASIGWLNIIKDRDGRIAKGSDGKALKAIYYVRVIYQCENGHFCSVDMNANHKPQFYSKPEFFTLSDDIDDIDAKFFKEVNSVGGKDDDSDDDYDDDGS